MDQKKCEDCKNKPICAFTEDFTTITADLKENKTDEVFTLTCKFYKCDSESQFRW